MTTQDNNFTQALKFTAKWEGIYSNDKVDPGGKTKYGISDAGDGTIDGLIDVDRDGKGDVKAEDLSLDQAISIYYNFYWLASNCDKHELPLAIVVFDTAVNCGVRRAKKWLKQSQDPKIIINIRRAYYYSLVDSNSNFKKFLHGWLNRLNDLNKYVDILRSG